MRGRMDGRWRTIRGGGGGGGGHRPCPGGCGGGRGAQRQGGGVGGRVGKVWGGGGGGVGPSPLPGEIVELPLLRTLVEGGQIVVGAGGGGIPVMRDEHGMWRGVEAVIDKDRT